MRESFKKLVIFWLILYLSYIGIFSANAVLAQNYVEFEHTSGLYVEFENAPLFTEGNFLPSEDVTKWIKIKNESGTEQEMKLEAINTTDEYGLGDKLDIVIKEGTSELYSKTLSEFFNDRDIPLSTVANGAEVQYDITIGFQETTDDNYQARSLSFDLLIGPAGEEGNISGGIPIFSGGGGTIPGLTIYNEGDINTSSTSATITWNTSYDATSRVIYDVNPDMFDFDAGEMSYGYTNYKDGDDILGPGKGTYHEVTLTRLMPDTTYYYRCVSHASPATISLEHSFTTLTKEQTLQKGEEGGEEGGGGKLNEGEKESKTGEQNIEEGTIPGTQEGAENISISGPGFSTEVSEKGEQEATTTKEETGGKEQEAVKKPGALGTFGANLASFLKNIPWLVLIIIAVLIFLGLFITRKKRKKENRGN